MPIKEIGTAWDRDNRNVMNENFNTLSNEIGKAVETITDKAYAQIIDGAKLTWKEPVASQTDLPPEASEGDTRMTRDTGKVFRFDSQSWNEIQQIDAGPVNEVDQRLTSQLAQSMLYAGNSNFNEGLNIFAHRGLQVVAPENTIPSIVEAKEYGMRGVEIDIRTTSDGVLILHHNLDVDKMTDGTGNVPDFTLAQIKELNIDIGNNIAKYPNLKIPTLEEALQVIKDLDLYVMIHIYAADPLAVLKLVEQYNLTTKTIISSTELSVLQEIRTVNKLILLSYIRSTYDIAWVNSAVELGNCYLGLAGNVVTFENVKEMHDMGIRVIVDSCYNLQQFYDLKTKFVDIILSDIAITGGY